MTKKYSTPWVFAVSLLLLIPSYAAATIVQFQTVMGNFEINLYDETTPETVSNFLSYVNSEDYANNIVHRSARNFVVQAGGFTFNDALPLDNVQQRPAVINEPVYSNVRGTIAMAKLGNDANSATSQWFININNNSANLDIQGDGFAVFGEVMDNGMDVVDAIAALPVFNLDNGALDSTPLRNFTGDDAANAVEPGNNNFVIITNVVILDAAADTASNLQPTPNTLIDAPTPTTPNTGGGGGSINLGLLVLLSLLALGRGLTVQFRMRRGKV